jgi:hypothetical protein
MTRRKLRIGLILAGVSLVGAGCDLMHHDLRSNADHASTSGDDSDSESLKEETASRSSTFKSNRLPGAMSNEGREVEKSLGIR